MHGERVEHLLLVIACALTRLQPEKVAPWLRERLSPAEFFERMKGG